MPQSNKISQCRKTFQDLSKLAFLPLYEALVRAHLEYGIPAHSPNLVAHTTSATTRDCSGWAFIPCSDDEFGLTWFPPSRYSLVSWMLIQFFFLPSIHRGLKGQPYKVLQGTSHWLRRRLAFSVSLAKYWNNLTASVVTATSVNISRRGWKKCGQTSFPIFPITPLP